MKRFGNCNIKERESTSFVPRIKCYIKKNQQITSPKYRKEGSRIVIRNTTCNINSK